MSTHDLTREVPAAVLELQADGQGGGVRPLDVLDALGVRPPSEIPSGAADSPSDDPAEGRVGRYRILAELGRGGMGRVLAAWDPDLRREVAVKLVLEPRAVTSERLARFVAEAQTTSQLDHPNIVPIHDFGVSEQGEVYFVMKKVAGRSLREVLDALRAGDVATTAEWTTHRLMLAFIQVCQAIGYAHERGVLHRDLKPDNVMLGEFGEVLVLDWGVARVGRQEPEELLFERVDRVSLAHTLDGATVGTPGYMSPEQARGELGELDARSDVWSLGSILYQLLTLSPPYDAPTPFALILAAATEQPPPPSLRAPERDIHPEIEGVCLRAMASEPEQRHASAQELGRAVEAYLEGSERRAGETRRRRIAALGLLVLVAVLAVTSSAFFRLWKQAEVARTEADARTLLAESRRHVASSSIEEAVALARAALTLQGGGPAGEVSAAQLDLELLGPGSAVVFEHELDRRDTAGLLVASPDRTLLALGSRKGRVELLDASGAAQLRLPDQDGKIEHLVFWPDGSRLVTSASGQPVRVWDVDSGELLRQLGERSVDPSVLTLRGIDETLVTARGSELVFWAADGEPAEIVQTQERAVSAVVFGIDGVLMAVLGDDASVWLSRASPPIERFVLKTPDRTRLLAWSPASDRIATAGAEGSLNLWHTDTDAGAMLLQAAGSRVEGLVFSPDGALLATSSDAEVQVWRTADGALVRQLVGHAEPITRMTFSSASDRLATADVGRHVRIWDMATGRTDKVWRGTGLRGLLNGLVWLPSDQEIVVAAGNTVLGLNAQLVSPQELLAASAEWTTFLVCRDTLTPAAAGGAYDPLTVWAPPERCALSPAILGLTRGYGIAEPDSDERPPPGPPSARGADAPGVPHRLCVMVDDQSAPQLDTRPGWEGEMRPAHPPGACSDGGVTDRWRTVRLDRTEPELHIVVLGGAGPFRGELQRVPLPPEWGADHASACLALTLRLDEDGRVQPAPLVEPLYEYVDGRCR